MIRFYVNGSLVASSPETTPITTSTNPLFIGGDQTMGQFFDGLIDEIRIYNVALTQAQIQADMDQHYVPLSFTSGSGTLNVQTPANGNLAPPGHYVLFILDTNGVPSVGSIVNIQ